MATHKHIDIICLTAGLLALLLTLLFCCAPLLGVQAAARELGYESRLFDTTQVHTIDIVMDDWDGFLQTCENEEYVACAVVIDGEAYKNVGLRAKGNTSLSAVSQLGSDRYSFKIEFDQYDSSKSYYGLDKLSLNNLIQDNTCMKDYLTYRMMGAFGVDAPLCSYVYLTVNGEDWGLYLAVEGVEDGFLQRNYGANHGELYKPDSQSLGGGRGNGQNFDFDPEQFDGQTMPDFPNNSFDGENGADAGENTNNVSGPGGASDGFQPPEGFDMTSGSMMGGMGSSDVKLQYIDDDPDSYASIFENAKTDVTQADQLRLIAVLKQLSAQENLEQVLDVDEVLRYFVVHNFVVNGDSYTGSMIHNYYLYEDDGQLSMIPWDYNLAFGTFQAGSASAAVNDPIDDVLSDRPMQSWIFSSETYTALYHQYYQQFLDSVDINALIDEAYKLIAPYVEKDPTAFCTYDEFETGVAALRSFCALRTQSVQGQLDGTVPSTSAAQSEDPDALIDPGTLTLSDMGTMNNGGGPSGDAPAFGADREWDNGTPPVMQPPGVLGNEESAGSDTDNSNGGQPPEAPSGGRPSGMQPPDGNGGDAGGAQAPDQTGRPQTNEASGQGNTLLLLGISAAVLLAGLVLALCFKR